MNRLEYKYSDNPHIQLQIAEHQSANQSGEWHLMFHVEPKSEMFMAQLQALRTAYHRYKVTQMPPQAAPRFIRIFLSDAANQAELVREVLADLFKEAPVSLLQQAPLDGSKLAMWVYLTETHPSTYTPHFVAGLTNASGDSETQMRNLFKDYTRNLNAQQCTLQHDCLRTWIFVRDVDVNYAGVVKGRREYFAENGLTKDTHYITSTGIQAQTAEAKELVLMDAYAVQGLQPEQVKFLYAKTHLNPTYEYNVTFERGTLVQYGDRRHIMLSGTASIDNTGAVVHPGDIINQTKRMWKNVEALLNEGGCTSDDLVHAIVYLRDVADYALVSDLFKARFPQLPTVFLLAPVCRPGWLVEMECMAIKDDYNPAYSPF